VSFSFLCVIRLLCFSPGVCFALNRVKGREMQLYLRALPQWEGRARRALTSVQPEENPNENYL
jgi:hypothetical protein